MKVGQKVKINANEKWFKCIWFPKGEVTGTVEKVFKNGNIAVAVDQIKNRSNDGLTTLHFTKEELE